MKTSNAGAGAPAQSVPNNQKLPLAGVRFFEAIPLVSQITYRSNTTTRMTTTKKYDHLNRLLDISSVPSASSAVKFSYQYNDANQRTRRTDSDESYWSYEYDSLGQVTSGKHYWSDGVPFAGQQFEYAYDDIGNRRRTREGGDASGSGLRTAHYTVNNLNQYTQRDVPGAADIIGIAYPFAPVTVNDQSTYRRGEYYHKELAIDNSSAPVWQSVTNQASYTTETNTTIGNLLLPKNPQTFWYDLDGNMLSDFVWTNSWDAESRMAVAESTAVVSTAGRAKEAWVFDDESRWVQRIVYSWNGSVYFPQSTNRFLWEAKVLVAVLDHTSNVAMSFLRGLDLSGSLHEAGGAGGLITVNIPTNGVHFCAYDDNGNVIGLANVQNAAISGSYDFDPFGNTLRVTGTAAKANSLRFSTQLADDVLPATKYVYRDHQSLIAKWMSRDPIGEQLDSNLYVFLNNDPVNAFDVHGLFCRRRVLCCTETITCTTCVNAMVGPVVIGSAWSGCSVTAAVGGATVNCCPRAVGTALAVTYTLPVACPMAIGATYSPTPRRIYQ